MSSTITLPSGSTYTLVQLPSYPGLSQWSIALIDSVAQVQSPFVPGQTQTQAWPGADAWSIQFTTPKMSRWTAAAWRGFLSELRGTQNVFQIGDPYATTPLGQPSGAPVCNTTGTNNLTSATSLVTEGWTPSTFGLLLAGDYIQLGYRLHQVCEPVNSDSGGNATISIWPSLRESPANGTALILTNTVGLFRLADNKRTWHSDYTSLTQISINAVEAR
jgi:hypothetical protein